MFFNSRVNWGFWAPIVASLVVACGGGGGGGGGAAAGSGAGVTTGAVSAALNVIPVTVDSGPAGGGTNVNRLYTNVTVCQPGSTTLCQTIDHVLVDTGSTGLRLLASVLAPALNLSRVTGGGGFPLLNCAQFVDGSFAWGPVATADIRLSGKTASTVPIQIIADPISAGLASQCSFGTTVNTSAVLGANGILGVGFFKEDCGSSCAAVAANGFYFTCANANCTVANPTTAPTAKQVKNPVALFSSDNNGIVIDMPGVSGGGTFSLTGGLIFGVGTQANNQLVGGTVLKTTASGYFTTLFAGRTLANSFLDTGSNGLYFDTNSIPLCPGGSGFYCPPGSTALSATLVGVNGTSIPVGFVIDNAFALFSGSTTAVLPTLSGNIGNARSFDWGLPFFYGRRIAMGIEGQPSPLGTGPFYAF